MTRFSALLLAATLATVSAPALAQNGGHMMGDDNHNMMGNDHNMSGHDGR